MTETSEVPYPAHWEADIVLRDGGTAVLRPIKPTDDELLVAFYARVSDQSKYMRFFAPYPTLSQRDVDRFTRVDQQERIALILTVGDEMVAVGRCDRIDADEAEVAFLVEDAQQGRGIGSVLLEHLAQAARENGVHRFVAEILPDNRRMITVFREAGYQVARGFDDGVVRLELQIEPTASSLEVTRGREHRAEARSVERLLRPESVTVIGASRHRDTVGQLLVRNLIHSGFTGPVYAVNPSARAVAGVPAYPSVSEIPGEVELAVIAVPAEQVHDEVIACAEKNVHGLVVVSSGFAETGEEGKQRQREMVALARSHGLRVLGPNALGLINTDPQVSINASLSSVVPDRGRVGFFCQSGALGTVILETVRRRGIGLSSFVSAGNRGDVSGNDVMQYWEEDTGTDAVLLYLESIGNPRKFNRIARRLSFAKPVVAVRSGRFTQGVPLGHTVRRTGVPSAAVEAMFGQAGVIQVDSIDAMLDVAQILAYQPLPRGGRIGIVGNSEALRLLATDAAVEANLSLVREPATLTADAGAADLASALAETLADPTVDAVVLVYVSPLDASGHDVATAVAEVVADSCKPVVTTFLGSEGVPASLRHTDADGAPLRGSVPSYTSPEAAVRALAKVSGYARWRSSPQGQIPPLEDISADKATEIVESVLTDHPNGADLSVEQSRALFAAYGVQVWSTHEVATLEEAVAAAEDFGWNVVLKATAPHLRQRPDLADVWRNIDDPEEMRQAWDSMRDVIGDPESSRFAVQQMAPPGVPVIIRSVEDPLFGPILSFGVAGVVTDLLEDLAYRIPPVTDVEVAAMVREVRAAPLLFGHSGGEHADVRALEDVLHRIGRLAYDVPEVASAELVPVLAGGDGVAVLGGSARVAPSPVPNRDDRLVRSLTRL